MPTDFEDWAAEHRPQANPTARHHEAWLYAADGNDLAYVRTVASRQPLHVWSMVEAEGRRENVVLPGYAEGADGYLITEEPGDPWKDHEVVR